MEIYTSMLRGINVGGHRKVPMAELRALYEKLKLMHVKTYIQSGNVVFATAKTDPAALTQKLEESIAKQFGFEVSVITRNIDEIAATLKQNPFLKTTEDTTRLHVSFLSETPAPEALTALEKVESGEDQWKVKGHVLYLYCPNGYGNTKLSPTTIERKLKVVSTTRNWRTVNELYTMMQAIKGS